MEPTTILLIAEGLAVGGAAILAPLSIWLASRRASRKPAAIPLTPEEEEQQRLLQEEEDRRRRELQEEEDRQRAEQEAEAEKQREQERAKYEKKLHVAVRVLTENIQFTHRRVYVGHRKTGEKHLGYRIEEHPYPADNVALRPLRDMSELPQMLPSELALDDDMFDARLATGATMVTIHERHVPVMEDIHEAQYIEKIRIVYVLLDVSPSMFPRHAPWRVPLWKSICLTLLDKAMAVEAPFYLREFHQDVKRTLKTAVNNEQADKLRHRIHNAKEGSGTDIQRALMKAIEDFSGQEYDEADIMIVTDGEDTEIDIDAVRAGLEGAGIRLHAIMLGVSNEHLRACCDVYQIVDENLDTYPVVRRKEVEAS